MYMCVCVSVKEPCLWLHRLQVELKFLHLHLVLVQLAACLHYLLEEIKMSPSASPYASILSPITLQGHA